MKFSFARPAVLGFGALLALTPAWAADGKAVYEKTCALCHAQGVANAPRFGDRAAWAPRLAVAGPRWWLRSSKARAPCRPGPALLD